MNRITSLLGIRYPIIQGGMVWCSGWRLASAVSNAGGLEVLLSLGGDVARIAGVRLFGERIHHGEVHDEGLAGTERVNERGGYVRNELHIGLVDGGEATDRGAVKHETLGEDVILESSDRDAEMLHHSGKIAETNIDELDVLLLSVGNSLFSA